MSATVELERGTIQDTEPVQQEETPPDKFCHLYKKILFDPPPSHTMCGLPIGEDWHANAHAANEQPRWNKGLMRCPVCDTPICLDCLLAAG